MDAFTQMLFREVDGGTKGVDFSSNYLLGWVYFDGGLDILTSRCSTNEVVTLSCSDSGEGVMGTPTI